MDTPLAIDLAIQLLHYGEASREIIDKLVHSKDMNEELSHRLLDEIFNHPKSTEQEKEFLLNFSIFRNKVFSKAFEYISDDPDRMTILHKLMDKHMIMHYEKLYGAHPLVREFCYHRLENKEKLHLNAYEYLKVIRQERLDIILEEEVFYHLLNGEQLHELAGLISEKGEDFILLGHTNFLKEMMDAIVKRGIEQAVFYLYYGDIAQIRGEWDDATNYFKKSFSFPNVDEKTNAMAYIKYGEMLYRKGQVKESLEYFEKGVDICKKNNFRKGEARSLNDIGLVSDIRGDLDGAISRYKESLEIRKKVGDKSGIAISLNNIGLVLRKRGALDGAMSKYRESMKIREEIGGRRGIATTFHNIGTLYFGNKDFQNALINLFKSMALSNQMGIKQQEAYNYISKVRKILGFKKFKNLAEETFDKLPEDLKPFIDMKEFTEDKTIHVTQEPGRNAPCPCGSGKKYKQCCGRS